MHESLSDEDITRIAEAVHARFDTLPSDVWRELNKHRGGMAWSEVGYGGPYPLRQKWTIGPNGDSLILELLTVNSEIIYRKVFLRGY